MLVNCLSLLFFCILLIVPVCSYVKQSSLITQTHHNTALYGKISPNRGESLETYRNTILRVLQKEKEKRKLGIFDGRQMLELIVKKWGVAYDVQLRKNKPFGDASANIYINIMWKYYGQVSFPMKEQEYLEHLEAIARYLRAIKKVDHFKEKVAESKKRPNAYFGYAVGIPLDVDPDTADEFFKGLKYE